MKYFKIYGKQRTGTNYIATTLQDNFIDTKVFMNVGGWKHGELITIPDNVNLINRVDKITQKNINVNETIDLFKNNQVFFIVMIKNPYTWINSMYNIYKKITNINQDIFVINQIKLWNKIYLDYKEHIESGKAYLIKYETLLQEPDKVLKDIEKKYNLERKYEDSFKLQKNKLAACLDIDIGRCYDKIFDPSIYINTQIDQILSKNTIEIINKNIDIDLMNYYNYDIGKI